jgi:hypothetical protein
MTPFTAEETLDFSRRHARLIRSTTLAGEESTLGSVAFRHCIQWRMNYGQGTVLPLTICAGSSVPTLSTNQRPAFIIIIIVG